MISEMVIIDQRMWIYPLKILRSLSFCLRFFNFINNFILYILMKCILKKKKILFAFLNIVRLFYFYFVIFFNYNHEVSMKNENNESNLLASSASSADTMNSSPKIWKEGASIIFLIIWPVDIPSKILNLFSG